VQEALTNCARHAQAKTIDVKVRGEEGQLGVLVRDDGIGFDTSSVRGRGLGLIGLEERVRELGGKISLRSQPHKGTVVLAKIPIPVEAAQNEYSHSSGR
jgi:signal transduction histidine kinase